MRSSDDLLETLRDYMGCSFISDLRSTLWTGRVPSGDPPAWMTDGTYSLEEWARAVWYITGCRRPFISAREASRFLIEHMDGPE